MEQSPWEANSHSATQEVPRLLWNLRFITDFKVARLWFPSRAWCIQSTPSPFSLRSSLILFSHLSHLRQCLPSDLFPSGFPTKITFELSLACVLHAPSTQSSFILSSQLYLVMRTSYEAPRYVVFSFSCYFLPLRSKYFPQHPVLRYLQSMLLLNCTLRGYMKLLKVTVIQMFL